MADWWLTRYGDVDCLALYERHYSACDWSDGRKRKTFTGVGQKIVLRTFTADAIFVWRFDTRPEDRELLGRDRGEKGVCCAVFRNESGHRSSDLIRQADAIADCVWPHSRHYTYVNADRVKSRNPGFCFLVAGWKRCGMTKSGLLILERLAQ